MPIYDYNGKTRKVKDLKYKDEKRNFANSSRVVHFGYGDVLVSTAKSRDEKEDELVFQHTEPHEIGTFDDGKAELADPPVRFIFDKLESVDVVIDMCQKLKEKMVAQAKVN